VQVEIAFCGLERRGAAKIARRVHGTITRAEPHHPARTFPMMWGAFFVGCGAEFEYSLVTNNLVATTPSGKSRDSFRGASSNPTVPFVAFVHAPTPSAGRTDHLKAAS